MFKSQLIYDKRLIDRHLKRGIISREEWEKHLAELPDVASKSERLSLDDDDQDADDEK